ncbi:MAG: helix-turn-helix domain-containing protein [Methanomassiliicoccaceae archaeon]|nr:helix-turn-helix domain-containing protein [Methanomassiliicoccaceae archaeon]
MFELNVVSNTPLGAMTDMDTVAETFLTQIGYIPKGYDPKTDARSVRESVPYRLFMDFFVRNTSKIWTVDELAALMRTTKPTIYRHINKLKSMDILESADTEFDGQMRKGYRIRYGDLRKAWSFTEANVNMAMENYRKTVEHFQKLADEEARDRV